MKRGLTCSCGEVIIKGMPDSSVKIRSKIMLCKSNNFLAVCKSCGNEVPVPITWDAGKILNGEDKEHLRLYVKK